MIGCGKPVKFKLAWQTYSVGDEIDPPATLRDWLIANGYVDAVAPALPEKKGQVTSKARAAEQARGGLFNR